MFSELEAEQHYQLGASKQLIEASKPKVDVEDTDAILQILYRLPLTAFQDRVAAMPSRFDQDEFGAAKLLEPEIQDVAIPSRTLKTEEDVDAWLEEVGELLRTKIKKGPVIV